MQNKAFQAPLAHILKQLIALLPGERESMKLCGVRRGIRNHVLSKVRLSTVSSCFTLTQGPSFSLYSSLLLTMTLATPC